MLAHNVVKPESSQPAEYMIFLHGILGTRANWRALARRFVQGRPTWGAILVDLREHGDSLGAPAPHTLEAAAEDIVELEHTLALPIGGALGHSFGGKVVLKWLTLRRAAPIEAWLVDSAPGRISASRDSMATIAVLDTLEALPREWPSREAFISALVESGQPEPIAQWLAKNLRRADDGRRLFGPDLGAIRELVEDYARTDLWSVIEAPPAGCTFQIVIGGRSAVFSPSDRVRVQELAERNSEVFVHVIEQADHWVHIDATDELVSLLTSAPSPQR